MTAASPGSRPGATECDLPGSGGPRPGGPELNRASPRR